MTASLKTLISKLNDHCRRAAERAASLTRARGHFEVDIEHLLLALLEQPAADLAVLSRRFEVPATALAQDLERAMAQLQTGNTRTPVFSARLPQLLEHAWLIASLDAADARIRGAHLVLALLSEPTLHQMALRASPLFARFSVDALKHRVSEATAGSEEQPRVAAAPAGSADSDAAPEAALSGAAPSRTPALDQYTTNLTARAQAGKLDPVIGRDAEIRQAIDILMRRRQNNPILTGEAGVGKTAVVEGLALKIAAGEVPPALLGVQLHALDMGLLQAGASVKGEFENRLKGVIDEVKASPHPIVLFIDEAHTMIGAGGQAGQNDAANLLKPALARGELRTVAATTWAEYKKYFEKDAALARRFQVVKVEEPDETTAAAMLRGMTPLMEKHFGVRVLDEAITEAVRLSSRYISGRQLPDKAISVLDTACAQVALGQNAVPAAIESRAKALERLQAEDVALAREVAAGADHRERRAELAEQREALDAELQALRTQLEAEQALVAQIHALHAELQAVPAEPVLSAMPAAQADDAKPTRANKAKAAPPVAVSPERAALQARLRDLEAQLHALQGEQPLRPTQVDASVVAQIISAWTGVPLGKMVKDEIQTVLGLAKALKARVIGQDHALESIAQRVRTARANLEDPNKPKGVFLFAGPSGVGKTETALALADALYGGEKRLVTINMSEYQEAHSVSGLKGSPPGYVGYGEGGVLTEAVRRQPYSVVLLDEVEKAHPDVLEMFFQVFDKGTLNDAEGREIDFRNTLIILTSNLGSSQIMQACLNKPAEELEAPGYADALADALRPVLMKTFKPAFLGRMKLIPYFPISDPVLEQIIRLKLDRIAERAQANHRAPLTYDDKLVDAVLTRCTEVDSGARNVDHILNGTLLPEIAEAVLSRMAEGRGIEKIVLSADGPKAKTPGKFKVKVQ
ncbi:type VI secretion system ATPase TssH [Roseateles sp. BYS87W]|uniref:Type VI secretion system ATPase TssH n=1 Tax=Pelomonas baiyunensis TaxID=3299026 RepID=A0ABW7H608_9BURK